MSTINSGGILPGIVNTNSNEKVLSVLTGGIFGKSKSISYPDIIQKFTNELKSRFKINEETKILKDFESFYLNLQEKLSLLKTQFDSSNKNQNNTTEGNQITYNVKYLILFSACDRKN